MEQPAPGFNAPSADDHLSEVSLLHAVNEATEHIQNCARIQDLPNLVRSIVEQAARLLHGDGGSFYRVNPHSQTVCCEVCTHPTTKDYAGVILGFGEGLAGKVAQTRQALVIDDYRVWPGRAEVYEYDQPFRAVICAPVSWMGEIIGVLQVLSSDEGKRFSQQDQELLTLFSHQAGVAIENARLNAAAATERQHLSLLYNIGREISSSLNPNEILERAITLTGRAFQGLTTGAYIYNSEDNRLHLHAMTGYENAADKTLDAQLNLDLGQGLVGWVAEHRQSVCVSDVLMDPRWMHVPGLDDGGRAAICSPIQFGSELLGVMSVVHPQPGHFTSEHSSLLQAICQSVGVAYSNAVRHEETQRRLAEITLIQTMADIFNQRLEVQELLDEAACQLAQRLSYAAVSIYLVTGAQLELRASCNHSSIITPPPSSLEFINQVTRTGKPALVRDSTDADQNPVAASDTYLELDVPIFMGKSVVGVISIHKESQGQITQDDNEIIQVLAGQISTALENAVLYDQLRRQTQDLEATVAQRTAELAELYDLSQEIAFIYSFPDLLQRLLRRLRKAMRCDLAAVSLRIGGKSYYYLESRRKIVEAVGVEARSHCSKNIHTGGLLAYESSPMIRPEDFDESLPPLQWLNSTLDAPIIVGQRMAGALFIGDEKSGGFSEEYERLLTTFANQASSATARLSSILSEQQEEWESLVEHLPVGVLLLDPDFHLKVINPLGDELLQALNGSTPNTDKTIAHLGALNLKELTERLDISTPVEVAIATPTPRVISAQVRPVRSPASGGAHPWVLMLTDVTQEKENQKRLQSQDRLATVGQLAAGIAHDFNNIMATILVYSDLLRFDTTISKPSQDKLAVIRAQIQRASSLIRQILDFSRRSVIEHVTLDLLPLLKEFDKMLIRVLPETIHLELAYQPGSYWVNGDPTRLQQVFMNLAVNARDAMPQGGLLRFEMSTVPALPADLHAPTEKPAAGWIRIIVSDTGYGMPPNVLEHIFEPFYTTKPPGEGTGLGLAQVYGIITQHGGAIDVETQIGQGTHISLYLPAVQIQRKETGPLALPAIFNGVGHTVLVVEDDAATREAIYTLLEASQCNVLAAVNGVDALQKFRNAPRPIDAVISDIVMPEMGGVRLYEAIHKISPDIKMLMITGHPLDENNQQMLEAGNICWLQKPFSISEFSRALAGLFNPG